MDALAIINGDGNIGAGGGVYINQAETTIRNSTISGNEAGGGGGIFVEQVTAFTSNLTLINSTVANNTATNAQGGGVNVFNTSAVIINSTISGFPFLCLM